MMSFEVIYSKIMRAVNSIYSQGDYYLVPEGAISESGSFIKFKSYYEKIIDISKSSTFILRQLCLHNSI